MVPVIIEAAEEGKMIGTEWMITVVLCVHALSSHLTWR